MGNAYNNRFRIHTERLCYKKIHPWEMGCFNHKYTEISGKFRTSGSEFWQTPESQHSKYRIFYDNTIVLIVFHANELRL